MSSAMHLLWAPWRSRYLAGLTEKSVECPFCEAPREDLPQASLVLHKGETAYVLLNLYPYNAGHVMAVPYRHLDNPLQLTARERQELFDLALVAQQALTRLCRPHGFNLGMNVGRAGGAGIEQHLHLHLVPRWDGDANFMTTVAGERVLSEDLSSLRTKLAPIFAQVLREESLPD